MGTDKEGGKMNGADDRSFDHWSLDKRVPVAVIAMLFIQTGGAFWWAATTSANIGALSQRIEVLEKSNALQIAQGNAISALDAKVSATQESIKEVKSMVMGLFNANILPLKEKK